MTIDRRTTLPPQWAESLLLLLLKPEDRDVISGDLLEEYRESIAPALGRGANRWYVGQVCWFVWRASWVWGAVVGAILVVRNLLDALVPVTYQPGVFAPRSMFMTNAVIATFMLAAFWSAWRSGRARGGLLVAFVAGVIGGALTSVGGVAMLAIWHDSDTLRAIRSSGGLDELLWAVPLELLLIGPICGVPGALFGKLGAFVHGISDRNVKSA